VFAATIFFTVRQNLFFESAIYNNVLDLFGLTKQSQKTDGTTTPFHRTTHLFCKNRILFCRNDSPTDGNRILFGGNRLPTDGTSVLFNGNQLPFCRNDSPFNGNGILFNGTAILIQRTRNQLDKTSKDFCLNLALTQLKTRLQATLGLALAWGDPTRHQLCQFYFAFVRA
jgi:hypothetical protein